MIKVLRNYYRRQVYNKPYQNKLIPVFHIPYYKELTQCIYWRESKILALKQNQFKINLNLPSVDFGVVLIDSTLLSDLIIRKEAHR